jgi:iron complex transport system substrate-binding protein
VRLAGGEPVLAEVGGPSRSVDLETLEHARPDVVVLQPCGFDLARGRAAWDEAALLRGAVGRLRDARGEPVRVALADGDAFFNRPGPRLVESAELLAEILGPSRASRSLSGHWCALQGEATR